MNRLAQLVIVEDNPMYRELLVAHFKEQAQYEVLAFPNAEACLQGVDTRPDAFLLDQNLGMEERGEMSGLQLFRSLRNLKLNAPTLFLTGHEAVQPAAEIMKAGAFDYMRKEYTDLSQVSHRIAQMVQWGQLSQKRQHLNRNYLYSRRRMFLLLGLMGALLAGTFFLL